MGLAAMWLPASLLCLTLFPAHIYCEDVFGIVGENFTFPVKVDRKLVDTTWKKNKDKVAEWEEQNKPTYFGPLRNRGVLMESGSLTILNLEKGDAGTYELRYRDYVEDHYLNFVLDVLDPLPEPKISCNTSDHKLMLNCAANFQRPLNYTWKWSNNTESYQELSIPLEEVATTANATCIIKFSQTERSSEISLIQCLPDKKGGSSYKRNRGALIAAVVLTVAVGILLFLLWKGKINLGRGRKTAQKNCPVNGSGEHEQLFHENSQQQPQSEGAGFSQAVHCESEEPEADRELNEEDSALKDKQIVKSGVNQEDTLKKNSSLLANHADDCGINEGEVTQDAESGTGEHLNTSPSCSKEDLKSKASNFCVAQTNTDEKR